LDAAFAYNEKKAVCCDAPCSPKDNIEKGEAPKNGKAEDAVEHEKAELPKEMTESTVNEEEVLGWNRNADYMDKSHGTEIGDTAPFNDATARDIDDDKQVSATSEMKNGVVENHGTSMHDTDSQDTPSVGVGEGPSNDNNKPFNDKKGKQIDEAIDDLDGEGDVDLDGEGDGLGDGLGDEGFEGEEPIEGGEEGEGLEGDEHIEDEGEDPYEDDLESRVAAMEDLLSQIAAKLGVEEAPVDDEPYEDDDLFDEDEFEASDDDVVDDDMPMESRRRRNDVQIVETRGFRNAMRRQRMNEEGMKPFKDGGRVPQGNMNKLGDFGKHPAYQKKVMELPPKDMQEFPGYYDMNDDSVRNDNPYGEKIGSSAPFEIDPQAIDNAIAEAFNRLKKKSK